MTHKKIMFFHKRCIWRDVKIRKEMSKGYEGKYICFYDVETRMTHVKSCIAHMSLSWGIKNIFVREMIHIWLIRMTYILAHWGTREWCARICVCAKKNWCVRWCIFDTFVWHVWDTASEIWSDVSDARKCVCVQRNISVCDDAYLTHLYDIYQTHWVTSEWCESDMCHTNVKYALSHTLSDIWVTWVWYKIRHIKTDTLSDILSQTH